MIRVTYDGKSVKIDGIFKFKIINQGIRGQLLKDAIFGRKSKDYKLSNIHGINERLRNLFIKVKVDVDSVNLSTVCVKNNPSVNALIIEAIKSSVPAFVVDKQYVVDNRFVSINSDLQVVVDNVAYNIITKNCDRMVALAKMLTVGGTVNWFDIAPSKTSMIFDDNYRYKWIQSFKDCIMNSPLKIETNSRRASYRLTVS